MADLQTIGSGSVHVAGFWDRSRVGAAFGIVAGILNLVVFVWYCWTAFSGETTTNPISWWLWFAETLFCLFIYIDRTRDFPTWFTEAASMLGVTVISGYLIWEILIGDSSIVFASVETVDYVALGFAVLAFVVWAFTRKDDGKGPAIWFFQLALLSAIFPLVRSAYTDPTSEPLGPWIAWTFVFLFQTICAWLRVREPGAVVNPLMYTITHALVVGAMILGAASS